MPATTELTNWLSYLREFGSLGILAFIVWFVFTKGIPMIASALKELAQMQQNVAIEVTRLTAEVDKLGEKIDAHSTEMRVAHTSEMFSMLTAKDAHRP